MCNTPFLQSFTKPNKPRWMEKINLTMNFHYFLSWALVKKSFEIKLRALPGDFTPTKLITCRSTAILFLFKYPNSFHPFPHFCVFGLNTEIHRVNRCIQLKYEKTRTRKKVQARTFIAQCIKKIWKKINSLGMILFINKVTPFGIISFY